MLLSLDPRLLLATAALGVTSVATAQIPNDDCPGAIPITLGANGPFTNVGSTTSAPAFSCVTGGNDVWFLYVAECNGHSVSTCGSDFDTCIEVYDGSGGCTALTSVACNDDDCFRQSTAAWTATPGTLYYVRVGGWDDGTTGGDTGNFNITLTCDLGIQMVASADAALPAASLSANDTSFVAGEFLSWNYSDPNSTYTGQFATTVLNWGPAPIGNTATIPGLFQLWAGSTPAGVDILLPPNTVGGPDQTFQFPAAFLIHGLSMRLQGLVLDTVNNPGVFPVVCTSNTVELFGVACPHFEDFDGLAQGVGSYPTGWSNGGGQQEWRVDANGTGSFGTGPAAAFSAGNYMYCEASSPATFGTTFIMNTATYPSAGLTEVAFQLSRNGENIGTLEVYMGDGLGTFPTLLGSFSGPAVSDPDYWTPVSLPLGGGLPANVQFQLFYTNGTAGSQFFYGDLAIDDFCVR